MNDCPQESLIELDVPRENERKYEELFGNSSDEQKGTGGYTCFYPPTIFNQGAKDITRMACGGYGICHGINAQNLAVSKIDGMRFYEIPPEGQWKIRIKKEPQAEKQGTSLQSWLDTMKELGYITGDSRVSTIEDMKNALRAFRPIYTGSKQCNWASVRDFKRYELGTGYAHIFCIVGFDGSGWVAVNSYGSNNGIFHIDYKYTDSLFSCYALSDSRDQHLFV